jgi:hypothetical protein
LKLLTQLIGGALMVPAAVLGISAYENRQLAVCHHSIFSKKLPKEFDGLKIVFLSDLHNHQFGMRNHMLVREVKRQEPDLILVGGDLVVGKPGNHTEIAYDLLKQLAGCCSCPIVCANGNHEYRMKLYTDIYGTEYRDYRSKLEKLGITYLENERISIQKEDALICISGLEIKKKYYKRGRKVPMKPEYLLDELGETNPDVFQILLAHNPIYFPEYAKWGADLVLSGHNHGGLIRLPLLGGAVSPQIQIFPKYDAGYYKEGDAQMLISRGLGTHTLAIRVNNRPELSVIHLHGGVK